nr:MAG TPA: Putative transferase, nesg, ydcK, Structural Genomics.38A [Caudoviricetes sp.]
MSRKYEIVNVGGVNRVRALRSWVVQGRQVNVGDVGGAVFDEHTLSQDGACWIFSGRLDNPLVRVGGDSVVNIGDNIQSRFPFVNIFGTSSLDANISVNFVMDSPGKYIPLTPAMMEQGAYGGGVGQPLSKGEAASQIRTKTRMFTGGGSWVVPAPAEGYSIRVVATDTEGIVIYNSGNTSTKVTVPAGAHAYAYITVMKSPLAAIVPADVTEAALTYQDFAEATINIVDSHITLTGQIGGRLVIAASGDYQGNVTNIESSTLKVNQALVRGATALRLQCDLINTTATVNTKVSDTTVQGVYKNVKNLVWGVINWPRTLFFRTGIQATDCDNFVMDGTNIPLATVEAATTSNLPLVFTRCNMNKARIVNQPLIKNTYVDINFDLASADLGELTAGSFSRLASSNVNGMYRLCSSTGTLVGALVESYESVKALNLLSSANIPNTYNTTIYADAYLNGKFDIKGTNVFGNAVKKPKTRTIDVSRVAVQGDFNNTSAGSIITGVVNSPDYVCVPTPFPVNGSRGLTVNNVPSGIAGNMFFIVSNNVIANTQQISAGTTDIGGQALTRRKAFLRFSKTAGGAITPDDVKGVTVTTYNGCKIVNTKATAATIAGNVRVEDNATLMDVSVTGTGYFGGESVIEAPTALTAPLPIEGAVYMKDKAVFHPAAVTAGAGLSLLDMKNNAVFAGNLTVANTFYNISMSEDARFLGNTSTRSGFVMRDNSFVNTSTAIAGACRGLLFLTGKARIESGTLTAVGHITLTGDYRQTATKVWTGKRVIDSQDAPQYDDNVKTQYDF